MNLIILLAISLVIALLVVAIARIHLARHREEVHNATLSRDEVKAALTEKGIAFANNAPTEKLQALLDGTPGDQAPPDGAAGSVTERNPSLEADKAVVPAFAANLARRDPAVSADAEITAEEIAEKTRAGLTREQALEVIATQRAHDAALAAKDQ